MLRLTSTDGLIINHIRDNTPEGSCVYCRNWKMLPIIRSHTLLNNLHQVIDHVLR